MTTNLKNRYTTVAITLHWLIAAAIIIQILLGWRMGWAPKGSATGYVLFQLHKSVGITILLLSLARLAWRLFNPPPHVEQPRWEAFAASVVHVCFYVIMIGLPVTGWIMVSTSPTNIPTILYGHIPWPHLPFLPELAKAPKHAWMMAASLSHGALVKLTYALLALHLGAVAKHQLIDRDAVFSHMAAGAKPGLFEPRVWLVAASVCAVAAFGYFYTPTVKLAAPPPPPPTTALPPPAASSASLAPQAEMPATSATPAASSPAAAQEAPVQPVHWVVRDTSTLGFTASWSGQPINGHFKKWTADILFSPTALDKSRLSVSIDIASITTGDDQRDSTLSTDDWFAAAAHPMANFTASKFRKVSDGHFVADGVLEIRGVKKPTSLPFTLKTDGQTAQAQGQVTIDRTVFGVGQGDWAGTDAVPAAVLVDVSIDAHAPQ